MNSLNIKSRGINYNDQGFIGLTKVSSAFNLTEIPLIAILIFQKKLSAKLFIRMVSSGLDAVDI